MESKPEPVIGILFDHPTYLEKLGKFSDLNLIELPSSLKYSFQSTSLTNFQYNNYYFDYIIIYAHLNIPFQQSNYGLEWAKIFRLAGYNTPIIILTWNNPFKIASYYRLENPFIIKEYSDSVAVLQLPIKKDEIKSTLNTIYPLTIEKYIKCLEIFNEGRMSHELINIARQSDLHEAKKRFENLITGIPRLKKHENYVNDILNANSLGTFRSKIDKFRILTE